MWVCRLRAEGIRNLSFFDFEFVPGVNLILGENGAGKTSFLEVLYFLDRGNTFRGKKSGSFRGVHAKRCYGECWVTQENGRGRRLKRECSGRDGAVREKPTEPLNVRLVSDSIFMLIEGSPELRRRFIDWNLFHVEPLYGKLIRDFRRVASQRNAWLRAGARGPSVWDEGYTYLSKQMNSRRAAFCESLGASLVQINTEMQVFVTPPVVVWNPGFSAESLAEDLARMREADVQRGFTYLGPDRSDLKVQLGSRTTVGGFGSRGENKTIAVLLQMCGDRICNDSKDRAIWLVDDLKSDLSISNTNLLLDGLRGQARQVFLTAIDPVTSIAAKVFHVEHGTLSEAG